MTGRGRSVLVVAVAVALVASAPISYVGVAGGTHVAAGDGSGEEAVYPGQTVRVVNFSVGSDDIQYSQNENAYFGHPGSRFSIPVSSEPEMYIDTGQEIGEFDINDTVVRFRKYSRIEDNPTDRTLSKLPEEAVYIQPVSHETYSLGYPIIIDNPADGLLTDVDEITIGGELPLVPFSDTTENEVYLDSEEGDYEGLSINDPVFKTGIDGEPIRGPLDQGETELVRRGEAPINGLNSVDGDPYFINTIDDSQIADYGNGEAIISENGDGTLERGKLSDGDQVIKEGSANLNTFSDDEVFFIDEVEQDSDQYNPSESIIDDVGRKDGQLDGSDEIIFSGHDHVTRFESSEASFGNGDVYIGNSKDAILDDSEFLFVEGGQNVGYNAGEDLVLSVKGSPDLTKDEDTVTKLTNDGYTDIGYLDLNGNGQFDADSELESNPGSEPIVEFELPTTTPENNEIGQNTNILNAFGERSNVLEIQGTLFEGEKYQDIRNANGHYNDGELIFSDGKDGRVGKLDSNELIIEKSTSESSLTKEDYIIRNTDIDNTEANLVPNEIEYIDTNHNNEFDEAEPIIESGIPDDTILDTNDEIIDSGSSDFLVYIETNFEFLDSDEDGIYDHGETIIQSDDVGDHVLEPDNSIHMSNLDPGKADMENFDRELGSNNYAEAFIDAGTENGKLDADDFMISIEIPHQGDNKEIFGEGVEEFHERFGYIDETGDQKFSKDETIYFEADTSNSEFLFGDRLTALTVHNEGTLSPEEIEAVQLNQDGEEIATATSAYDGVWTLEPGQDDGIVPPGDATTNLSVTATLAADAPTDATVNFAVSAVDDGGLGGEFDAGDRGLFFADGPPVGGIDAGNTYVVADASDITAEAVAFRDPEADGSTAIELAFTDDVDPATTEPADFVIEAVADESANVTGVGDDDGDGRIVLEVEDGVAATAVEAVTLADGGLAVGSGAAVPGQTLAVASTSVTIAEADERPHVVHHGERVAVLANEGNGTENATPNLDETVRIDEDTTGDGSVDGLRQLGSTGESSLLTVIDTNESNESNTTAYRVTFQSEDGDPGESVTVPVENLTVSVTANETNTTDVAGPIAATVSASDGDRAVRADLLETPNETVLASQVVTLDEDGEGVVQFPAQVANVTIAVTDLGTGIANRTANVTVRKGHPGATFAREVFEEERGDVAGIEIRLVDTENATVSVGSEAVNYHETVSVADRDGSGDAVLELNTHRAGSGPAGTGVGLAANENRSKPNDRVTTVDRAAPVAAGLSEPLETGNYTLEVIVDGEVTDVALLQIVDRSTSGAETLVAPAGVALEDPEDVENWTTPRDTVAVGDQAVVAVDATGLDGFLNDSTDLRRGSPAAARTGAYVDLRRGNPPPNRPARRLNVSNASTLVDRGGDGLYVVVPSDGGPYAIQAGEEFDATFVLNDTSPYVSDAATSGEGGQESAETTIAFESPDGRFTDLDENETLDLPATAEASIAGETNVAPGTNVTITVRSDDDNVTFQESDEETVEDDGTFDGSVDLEDYPEGTEYTVVATANDDELTAVRTGSIVEAPITVAASQNVSASGQPSGGGGYEDETVEEETTTESATTAEPTTTPEATGSVGERAATFVTRDVPEFIRTQETNIVIVLGFVAFAYALVGLRRLTR